MDEQEIWKDVLGYEGAYLVSSLGRVKSMISKTPGLIRKQHARPDGYLQVQLMDGKKPRNRLTHTLVDEAFNGPRVDGMEVNHKDGVKHHNSLGNLERMNRSDNVRHALTNGLKVPLRGSAHGRALLLETQVLEIRAAVELGAGGRRKYGSVTRLAKQYGVSRSCITSILSGENWIGP